MVQSPTVALSRPPWSIASVLMVLAVGGSACTGDAPVTDPVNQPVYVRCGSANRVAGMWLIKRVSVDGWSIGEATTEAETIGLRSETLRDFAIDYVRTGGA